MIRFLLILLFPLLSYSQDVILSGRITNGATQEPISDVMVRLYIGPPVGEFKVKTDNEGYYSIITSLPVSDKNYPIIIQKDEFQVVRGVIKLNFGSEPQRDYKLYVKPERTEIAEQQQDGPSLLGAPTNNLTFLIDVSGSMDDNNRLADLKESLNYLVQHFRPEDKISIITYSSYSKVVLNNANATDKKKIEKIINNLSASGKSEGYTGLKKAYDLALTNFENSGNNKIILATDGIFGEDKKSQKEIEKLIANGLNQEVTLSIFSFVNEEEVTDRLKNWAKIGHGNYTNITSLESAKDQIIKEAKGD
ncbi:MAG: VWA domain-containing protein [Chitinophagales bacterium]